MKFEVIPFKELLGKKFNIPSYQRGYRWEKENVEALLNDIQEFANKDKIEKDKIEEEFYCLQPIVVKKNISLSAKEGTNVYDLLDGQQRLTTLWLILNTLRDNNDPEHPLSYDIQYESREKLFEKAIDSNSNPLDNIDLFYLKKAFETIKDWKGDPRDILNCLVPNNPTTVPHIRVIWYEFDQEKQDDKQSSSIKVFARLNYGKIALTDTELIKALLLQSDIYPDDKESLHSKNIMKERLFRIATEWDDIEKGLHNELLWGMLAPVDYNPANHIELLLKFVAKQIDKNNKYEITDTQKQDFHIISKYLGINDNISPTEYAKRVEELWTKIRDAYNAIRNWYTNDDFYHLIGLYILLKNTTDITSLIEQIYQQYTELSDKEAFKSFLKNEIGNLIQITKEKDEIPFELHNLTYGENNTEIIKILEALNIYLYLTNKNIDSRFNFRKFKDFKVTSLEHIHPQHLYFEDIKYEDLKNWYTNTKKIILANEEYKNTPKISNALLILDEKLSNQEKFKIAKKECQEAVEEIDRFFDKQAGMSEGHMHSLFNMALVDKNTNAALSNNLIDIKRSILQEREEKNETYVPLATNYVFNKHFSKTISDMKFWTKEDREAYFEVVKNAYEYFTQKTQNYE